MIQPVAYLGLALSPPEPSGGHGGRERREGGVFDLRNTCASWPGPWGDLRCWYGTTWGRWGQWVCINYLRAPQVMLSVLLQVKLHIWRIVAVWPKVHRLYLKQFVWNTPNLMWLHWEWPNVPNVPPKFQNLSHIVILTYFNFDNNAVCKSL